jgi:putative ABC transport system permease protein
MRASFTVAWSEVRRRRLQSAVIVIMVALASGTITLGLNLLLESRGPYDRAFKAQNGAHLKVFYDASQVTPGELASTSATIGASSAAGPWPDVYVTLFHPESSDGKSRHPLDLVGRDSAQAPAERFHMTSGRWVEAPGEVVVTRAFAAANHISLGDHLVSLHTADKPALTVVGEVVDISQTSPASDYSSVQAISRAQRAWALPSQVVDLARGSGLGYEMAYRFRSPPTQAELRDDMGRLQASLPSGAISAASNYLTTRDTYQADNQFLLILLLSFGVFALIASLATTINLVLGAVMAGYHDIGISKALGFTPGQVVGSLVAAMTIPAFAGCALGIPAGAALSVPLVNQAAERLDLPSPPAVSPLAASLALAGILIGVAAAAALPALRAGRMSAVAAIAAGAAAPLATSVAAVPPASAPPPASANEPGDQRRLRPSHPRSPHRPCCTDRRDHDRRRLRPPRGPDPGCAGDLTRQRRRVTHPRAHRERPPRHGHPEPPAADPRHPRVPQRAGDRSGSRGSGGRRRSPRRPLSVGLVGIPGSRPVARRDPRRSAAAPIRP